VTHGDAPIDQAARRYHRAWARAIDVSRAHTLSPFTQTLDDRSLEHVPSLLDDCGDDAALAVNIIGTYAAGGSTSTIAAVTEQLASWTADPRIDKLQYLSQRKAARAAHTDFLENISMGGTGVSYTCGWVGQRGAWEGLPCPMPAGDRTDHPGYGRCRTHRGRTLYERARGAWLMAHQFARELNITPWDALMKAVRIAAGKAAYCEWVLSQATNDLELEGRFGRTESGLLLHPDTGEPLGAGQLRDLSWWVDKSELWTHRMAQYSKMAIDAGVAAALLDKVTLEGQAIARVLNTMLQYAEESENVSPALIAELRAIARRELLSLEREGVHIVTTHDADARIVDGTYTKE